MTDYNHLITPPEELMQKWVRNASFVNAPPGTCPSTRKIAIQASNWGWQQRDASVSNELQEARDEELDACVESISKFYGEKSLVISLLLADRRPKPKSQAEEALEVFSSMWIEAVVINGIDLNASLRAKYDIIHTALKRLQELEEGDE